ncbi:MAG: PAS domain S-box protein [Fibrobacteres bacterium]|nr:PAS domain S-box protein [Fibrobacterota bacterium]
MAHQHVVQFYEQDSFLIAKLSDFLIEGFERGETGIVIATADHRQALTRRLNESGLKPEGLELKGRLLLLDAQETLSGFMRDELPDESLFQKAFHSIMKQAGAPGKAVRAFGEMVALLWMEGNENAAVRLEELWEDALAESPASLLCAYPIQGMSGAASLKPFRDVCERHSRVLPSESFSSPHVTDEERSRMVAELQQRAATLEGQAREMDELLEDVRQLHNLTFTLSHFTGLDETLQEILRHALMVYRTGQGVLFVPLEDGSGLHIESSIGFSPGFLEKFSLIAAGRGASGYCMLTRNPVIVEDIETDALFDDFRDMAQQGGFRAVHSMPLTTRDGRLIGVLSIHFPTRRRPTDRETKFGEMYSRLAADSIEQAQLRLVAAREQAGRQAAEKKRIEQSLVMEALNRSATHLSAEHDLEKIVQAVTDGGREITGAAFGAFFHNQIDEKGESYQLYTLSGAPREAFANFPMPRNTPVFGPTFEGKGPVRIDDILKSPLYGQLAPHHGMPKGHLPVRSYLAVSVVSRTGTVLGGLFYGHPEPGRFTEADEKNLTSLASQAAVAIDNANLYTALQKQIEQGRHRENSARHFAAIVESSNDAIISKDLNSTVLSWNKSAERIFGYSAEEMIGTSITRLIPENHLNEEPEILRRIQSGQTITHYDTIRRRKDGTLLNISLTVSPIKDGTGKIVGASKIARDITDLKVAEEQLRQAQKMEAVGRLAGGVAHDFNNLLTSILGFVDMALAETDSESEVAEYLEEVRKAGNRASTLTHQLLAYSRKQILAPRVVDLNESVMDLNKMLRRLIGEDLEFRTRLDPDLAKVKADPGQIQQVIMNLALNARDAMPSGGLLMIETENVYLDRAYVGNHPEATTGPHVQLTVTDTGMGMAPEILAHIFEPFFTTKEVGKGTGLGLSSVYGIVKQSGGSIAVDSHVGKGTVFRILFPAVDRKGHGLKEGPHQRKPGAEAHMDEIILLAEDESAVRKFLMAALKSHGYRVVEARDGADALEIGRKLQHIDLVLSDVVMPSMNGGKLATELKIIHPKAKFLFISGYTKDTVSMKDLGDGASFLQKPFTQGEILAKVREVLGTPATSG